MPESTQKTPRGVMIATAVLGFVILIPSLVGFVNKFIEFTNVVRGDPEGAFAMTPIVNYLLASLGFLCLLIWATCQGMFHDIEAPKRTMIEREQELDVEEPDVVPDWAGGTNRRNVRVQHLPAPPSHSGVTRTHE